MNKILLVAAFSLLFFAARTAYAQPEEQIPLTEGWRFMPGDSLVYARPEYRDAHWTNIAVGRFWESQGHENLDGLAWYRVKCVIPSRLKDRAFLKEGVRIVLGKIDDYDETFLNGELIGTNDRTLPRGTPPDTGFIHTNALFYNVDRSYVLSPDDPRIRWDGENTIAVRVFDQGGPGGFWSGGEHIRMVALRDYLTIATTAEPFVFEGRKATKKISLVNSAPAHALVGSLTTTVTEKISGVIIQRQSASVRLHAGETKVFPIVVPQQEQGAVVRYVYALSEVQDSIEATDELPYILTPPPSPLPRINGASVVGARPGRPFVFTIPATGEQPIVFSTKGLPPGLTLDRKSGIVTGHAPVRGSYLVTCTAQNNRGAATRTLRIEVGDKLALTPPMGWNSWNCWGLAVDQAKVLASAKVFRAKGLAEHGWTYINIDDGWEIKGDAPLPQRDAAGSILVNEKFPSLRVLGDSIHALGLRYGIYSSPGPLTCGGYTASYQHEGDDARSYASWGIDYLKYDWCSYDKFAKDTTRVEFKKPYEVMRKALDAVDRDIVYSLCQYGMGNVWEWGAEVGGNLWRTTGDITDSWESLRDIGFHQLANAPFAGPGHWNDPDMLVVGWVGWGPSLHPTKLTPDEQYTHISLWCLLSAPLLIGCDLERLDPYTLNLLTNDEVLAVNQDPLGKQAVPILKEGEMQVWKKELEGGDVALGVFNLGAHTQQYDVHLKEAGLSTNFRVRDLWRQKDQHHAGEALSLVVPSHGVVLLRVSKKNNPPFALETCFCGVAEFLE